MKNIKTLHLASFQGNIGDNANHAGAQKLFSRNGLPSICTEQLEIRRFFRKELFFDESFIREANSFDLLMIGGGNYFELWPKQTKTGTTIDLGPEELEKITTPILFYSLGVDPGQGCSEKNKNKFFEFLSYCSRSSKIFVSVRNDGAIKNIKHMYGDKFDGLIISIPDGGFFAEYSTEEILSSESSMQKRIGINIAGDMLNKRTDGGREGEYLEEFALFIERFLQDYYDFKIIFFPHIFRDIQVLSRLFDKLPDRIIRQQIEVSQYGQGDEWAKKIFGQYNKCEIIIGNRFHSNVIPIGQGIPTIGLANYIQIPNLYEELGLEDRIIECNKPNFSKELFTLVHETLENYNGIKQIYREILIKLNDGADTSIIKLKKWLAFQYKE